MKRPVNNVKIGIISLTLRLDIGNRNAQLRLGTPLWLDLSDYALWFKSYDTAQTKLFLDIFSGFGFCIDKSDRNCGGYYAKFSTGRQPFKTAMKRIKSLSKKGLLVSCTSESKLIKKCIFEKLSRGEML